MKNLRSEVKIFEKLLKADYNKLRTLPPKPGEPETWEKVTPVRNRYKDMTGSELKELIVTLREEAEVLCKRMQAINVKKGVTRYEREVVKPMVEQMIFDLVQVQNILTANDNNVSREEKIRLRRPTNAEEVSESLEVMSKDVGSIISGSKWTKGLRKK